VRSWCRTAAPDHKRSSRAPAVRSSRPCDSGRPRESEAPVCSAAPARYVLLPSNLAASCGRRRARTAASAACAVRTARGAGFPTAAVIAASTRSRASFVPGASLPLRYGEWAGRDMASSSAGTTWRTRLDGGTLIRKASVGHDALDPKRR
jgi:hypothetical protein